MNITDLTNSTDPFIADLGKQAQAAKDAHDAGTMSDGDYEAQVTQLTDLEAIGEACGSEDTKLALAEAVGYLAQFLAAA